MSFSKTEGKNEQNKNRESSHLSTEGKEVKDYSEACPGRVYQQSLSVIIARVVIVCSSFVCSSVHLK